ncbi:MAG: Cyclic nucleotide-binding protein [Parcubacteria group bacterium GW2011_GWC2_39_14]|nr:MAG: Cyclic nucleotide-binding protein [Parcubacteria group bacterium GW2011_GWC2_39_14]KKR55543.1 MAG: Cyclic nucleotide-binding protein [Parcubacteria group bacterium GW2011_GWA2_40_23]
MLRTKLLEGLDPLRHDQVIARFTTRQTFAAGQPIVLKGDEGTALFIVLLGGARIRLGDFEVDFLPGDVLGEIAFLDGQPRSVKITATVDGTEIASLSRETMDTISRVEPQLAMLIFKNLGIGLASHLRQTNEQLLALGGRERNALTKKAPGLLHFLTGLVH